MTRDQDNHDMSNAMKTLKFNGEYWYEDARSVPKRIAEWVIWVGGWRTFKTWPLRERLTFDKLVPISILGHRATFYAHWFDVKTPWGVLVVNLRDRYAYISRDGTSATAHTWLYGAPRAIREAAASRDPRAHGARESRERLAYS